MLPNLLIVGAMRSGTTSAYRYLARHPGIYMTPLKEPTYLAFTDGPPTYAGPGDEHLCQNIVTSRSEYERLFDDAGEAPVRGEASAMYLYVPQAIDAISRVCPDAHCLVVLREPVARAYSAFQYQRAREREPIPDFAAALAQEEVRRAENWSPMFHYDRAGRYADQLERLYSAIPHEQISVITHDALAAQGPRALTPLLARLGLAPLDGVNATAHNRSGASRHPHIERLLASSPAKRRAKERLPAPVRHGVERTLRRLDDWRSNQRITVPELDPELRARLRESHRSDILETARLTGLDLRAWT